MPMDTFYFKKRDKPIIDSIKKIAKDDDRSKSEIIVLAMKEYSEKYAPDNANQQVLTDLNDSPLKSIAFNRDKIFKLFLEKYPIEVNYKSIVQEVKKYYKDSKLITSLSPEISKLLIDKGIMVLR